MKIWVKLDGQDDSAALKISLNDIDFDVEEPDVADLLLRIPNVIDVHGKLPSALRLFSPVNPSVALSNRASVREVVAALPSPATALILRFANTREASELGLQRLSEVSVGQPTRNVSPAAQCTSKKKPESGTQSAAQKPTRNVGIPPRPKASADRPVGGDPTPTRKNCIAGSLNSPAGASSTPDMYKVAVPGTSASTAPRVRSRSGARSASAKKAAAPSPTRRTKIESDVTVKKSTLTPASSPRRKGPSTLSIRAARPLTRTNTRSEPFARQLSRDNILPHMVPAEGSTRCDSAVTKTNAAEDVLKDPPMSASQVKAVVKRLTASRAAMASAPETPCDTFVPQWGAASCRNCRRSKAEHHTKGAKRSGTPTSGPTKNADEVTTATAKSAAAAAAKPSKPTRPPTKARLATRPPISGEGRQEMPSAPHPNELGAPLRLSPVRVDRQPSVPQEMAPHGLENCVNLMGDLQECEDHSSVWSGGSVSCVGLSSHAARGLDRFYEEIAGPKIEGVPLTSPSSSTTPTSTSAQPSVGPARAPRGVEVGGEWIEPSEEVTSLSKDSLNAVSPDTARVSRPQLDLVADAPLNELKAVESEKPQVDACAEHPVVMSVSENLERFLNSEFGCSTRGDVLVRTAEASSRPSGESVKSSLETGDEGTTGRSTTASGGSETDQVAHKQLTRPVIPPLAVRTTEAVDVVGPFASRVGDAGSTHEPCSVEGLSAGSKQSEAVAPSSSAVAAILSSLSNDLYDD